jgi:hypothetical protein
MASIRENAGNFAILEGIKLTIDMKYGLQFHKTHKFTKQDKIPYNSE